MKVVIFCGGFGTRFKEETERIPKPMISIGGKPILWHIMKYYSCYGFKEFILCTGYKSEVIKDYFYHFAMHNADFTINLGDTGDVSFHNQPSIDWKVTVADTGWNTLKGGRLKRIEKYIDDDDFLLTYGDGVSDVDLRALLDFHRKHGKMVTVTGVYPPSLFGELIADDDGNVLDFSEKPQTTKGMINGGFFVLNRKIFDYLSADVKCDFEIGVLDRLVHQKDAMVYCHQGHWQCMDTLRDKVYLERLWEEGKAFWKIWED